MFRCGDGSLVMSSKCPRELGSWDRRVPTPLACVAVCHAIPHCADTLFCARPSRALGRSAYETLNRIHWRSGRVPTKRLRGGKHKNGVLRLHLIHRCIMHPQCSNPLPIPFRAWTQHMHPLVARWFDTLPTPSCGAPAFVWWVGRPWRRRSRRQKRAVLRPPGHAAAVFGQTFRGGRGVGTPRCRGAAGSGDPALVALRCRVGGHAWLDAGAGRRRRPAAVVVLSGWCSEWGNGI